MTHRLLIAVVVGAFSSSLGAAPVLAPPPQQLDPDVQPFVHVPAGQIAITHLRIIDGTGAPEVDDATLLIDGAKIAAVQSAASAVPAGYRVIDGSGVTALLGLVGMHGLLMAGPDPTGNGGVIPGFGDQREIELLVEAGFTPVEAVRISTLNGATYLGLQNRIGSIAAGKDADVMIVKGNPAANIADIEKVTLVFKDGVGYDSAKLTDSVKDRYGEY